ncbi:uncharacterized protein LOC135153730 [Lytechinus pictus]|uniref:uncharacterized protein LOC135153730 n=1 Tax=Lytechinus pictus TaxID=7653 RepID=UPI0030B9C621
MTENSWLSLIQASITNAFLRDISCCSFSSSSYIAILRIYISHYYIIISVTITKAIPSIHPTLTTLLCDDATETILLHNTTASIGIPGVSRSLLHLTTGLYLASGALRVHLLIAVHLVLVREGIA